MFFKPIQGIYTERKNLKDKISKYSTLIGKIETAKINEKLGKTLEDISACFNKLHEGIYLFMIFKSHRKEI